MANAELALIFNEINKSYFGGLLTTPRIVVNTVSERDNALYTPGMPNVVNALIQIANHTIADGYEQIYDTLLHEAIHHYLYLNGKYSKEHNSDFTQKANEIGAIRGYMLVTPDSREAEVWPSLSKK
jgi:hypothetical protein